MLGDKLVASGKITQAQLDDALKAQASSGGKKLGEILVAKGLCSQADIDSAMAG
jgi:hypothetical protein